MDENKIWALKLFSKSPLKQQKFEMIISMLEPLENKLCLDIGSDNGVISLLLRERGGLWSSADLIPETVASIKTLVVDRVDLLWDAGTPYADHSFDIIVIVDLLEHLENDQDFAKELVRILKPAGQLIVNVPNPKKGLWKKFKNSIGQTDAAHGHVRSGYNLKALQLLLGNDFVLEKHKAYFHILSDLVDTLITFALDKLKGNRGKKGTVVTKADLKSLSKTFKLFSLIYPILKMTVFIDSKLTFLHGNMLIASFRKK